jgi:Arc/MetJ family transcription regulator
VKVAERTVAGRPKCPLKRLHPRCILVCMRTTINLRDDLLEQAMAITRITEKTALIHAGLEALITADAARRLARLAGSDVRAAAGRRRRSPNPAPRRPRSS